MRPIQKPSIKYHRTAALLLGGVLMTMTFCGKPGSSAGDSNKENQITYANKGEKKMQTAAIISTRHGKIVVKLFPDVAPKHVASFKKLIGEKFYDGTTFHRVIPGFMIQGGDPISKDPNRRAMHGTGDPGYKIQAEFSDLNHSRGILSAARSANPDSAGSQFFICVADAPHLNGQYSVFGQVVDGMDVVDKIVAEKRDQRDNPLERVEMTITLEEREI